MASYPHIAVVDDDPSIRETLAAYLCGEGYTVSGAAEAEEFERLMRGTPIDLVLLDIRLPGKDGLTLTRELRQQSDIGIILVTGRGDRVDRILGLEYGADDYVAKPVDARELLPRVRNLLRRIELGKQSGQGKIREFAGLKLDLFRRRLTDPKGNEVPLTPAEYELLTVFARYPGRVMTRGELVGATTKRHWDPLDRTIDTLVRRLRQKIEADPDHPQLIVTVHGTGYMFAS